MTVRSGLGRYRHVAAGAFLALALAFSVFAVGCPPGNSGDYKLVISSTEGGSVTVPGEGVRSYDAGTVVELVAAPDEGYGFRRWTGDTAQIANPYSASTTITMNGNYSITATFGEEGEGGNGPFGP